MTAATQKPVPAVKTLSPEALDFAPGLLAIQDAPPSPAGRAVLWLIAGLFSLLVVWTTLANVDVVAVAPGKIIPSGKVKTIQPFETGIVKQIHVSDGQHVKQGDLLVDLDPSTSAADVNALQQRVAKGEQTLPLIQERARGSRKLARQGFVPRAAYLEIEEQRIAAEHDLEAQRQELIKAQERAKWQRLTAPVDGVVQQLAIHTVGGVVTPAQPLMVIVPDGERLIVEAYIANKDVGFVWAGQPIELKLEAFSFTKYGTVHGQLINVSEDAVQDEKLGLVYVARAALNESTMNIDGRRVNLSPGMAVTLEIKTGTRKLIEYFLSPIQRRTSESARER